MSYHQTMKINIHHFEVFKRLNPLNKICSYILFANLHENTFRLILLDNASNNRDNIKVLVEEKLLHTYLLGKQIFIYLFIFHITNKKVRCASIVDDFII